TEYPNTRRLGENMFPLILDYSKNLIQGMIKNNIVLNSDDLDEKANDASTALLEVILKDKDHCMRHSFGEYLKRLCKSVVYGPKMHEQNFSLNELIGDGEKEFGEMIVSTNKEGLNVEVERLNNQYEVETENNDLPACICSIIEKASSAIYSNTSKVEDSVLFLLGMNLKFRSRDEKAITDFYGVSGQQTKKFVERGELVLYDYLRNASK
ncbi:MAG: hypothetical protein ACRCZZ_04285, partial [Phocaeicola sp.]